MLCDWRRTASARHPRHALLRNVQSGKRAAAGGGAAGLRPGLPRSVDQSVASDKFRKPELRPHHAVRYSRHDAHDAWFSDNLEQLLRKHSRTAKKNGALKLAPPTLLQVALVPEL